MLPDLFYIINFSISIFASSISILIGMIMVLIVIINGQCRTITNLLMCNTAVVTMIYSLFQIFFAVYGLRYDWFSSQTACTFRAYCYTAVCISVPSSYAIQSLSRLFFAVLYKYKYLLSWRIHWYLILINYLLSVLGPIPILFVKNGYILEEESRLCITTTKVFTASILSVSIAYLFPLSIVISVYSIIFFHVRQSTRRVGGTRVCHGTTVTNNYVPNLKREMTLMRNILILVSILVCAGMPYLILVLWHVIHPPMPPPEPMYLLALITITVSFAIKMIVLFYMNKEMKNITIGYLRQILPFLF